VTSIVRIGSTELTNPPLLHALIAEPGHSWLWLAVRLYLAYMWLESGLEKLHSPAWTQTGLAVKGFWTHAVQMPLPPARPPIAYDWYREFIQMLLDSGAHAWFAKLICGSELLIGVALLAGFATGAAALGAAFLNWNFIMSGSGSVNGVMIALALLLVIAWRTAGYIGLDRWLLPRIGTPWDGNGVFANRPGAGPPA